VPKSRKPDFSKGFSVDRVPEGGIVQGKVGKQDALLVRRGEELFAIGPTCTHYSGPLAEGLVDGDEIRCPWHHACFDLRTGEALRAPAFDPIPCWKVEREGKKVFAREKLAPPEPSKAHPASEQEPPASVVIVGGGAAGFAAAEMLRRLGYAGTLTMISADESGPVDRPNLSKDYLAGKASEDWIPLRPPEFYKEQKIDLVLKTRVSAIDVKAKFVRTESGTDYKYGALLLATGAAPVKLSTPGASEGQVLYLRTYADSQAIIEKAKKAKRVVVVGGSFIALEAAASLRERKIQVHVIAPDKVPLEKVFGTPVGKFVQGLHQSHRVKMHLGEKVARVNGKEVELSGGDKIKAVDFLVAGVGVNPSIDLAEKAGLKVDQGVLVDEYLRTSDPHIFAAGDIARWPDVHTGEPTRIEHWVVAECQGQTAAKNILGYKERFAAAPFFWTEQYGVSIRYVGHAEKWDTTKVSGKLKAKDCSVTYKRDGKTLAVATINRDRESLKAQVSIERGED
jgi:NADPH-dependent 2,4-dienoyl-CoA reductase/sulfur reductase-like enzyme/nitrite reductase/ring-hydroxylating ferredoxin subunit